MPHMSNLPFVAIGILVITLSTVFNLNSWFNDGRSMISLSMSSPFMVRCWFLLKNKLMKL